MTVEGSSPEDLNDGDSRRPPVTGDQVDLDGDGVGRVAEDGLSSEAVPSDNSGTMYSSADRRRSENSFTIGFESISGGRRFQAFEDYDGKQDRDGGIRQPDSGNNRTGNTSSSVQADVPDPGDISLTGNRNAAVLGRLFARRLRIPAILELHGRASYLVEVTKVSIDGDSNEDVTEDEDDGWVSVGDRGDRVVSNPAIDLGPIGGKSKFWALTDDDESDEEIVQSPYTPDLVRQAAVHGFTKKKLVEAEMALQDSSIQRR
jgi:hypothetical protein